MKTRLHVHIDMTFEPTDTLGEPQELTDEEVETLRERLVEQASVMGRPFRSLGRGKGYAIYAISEADSVRVTCHREDPAIEYGAGSVPAEAWADDDSGPMGF